MSGGPLGGKADPPLFRVVNAMHPLMVPFTNTDFYWNVRLSKLLLPDVSGRTAIRLLNSKELLKYTTQGIIMPFIQQIGCSMSGTDMDIQEER